MLKIKYNLTKLKKDIKLFPPQAEVIDLKLIEEKNIWIDPKTIMLVKKYLEKKIKYFFFLIEEVTHHL